MWLTALKWLALIGLCLGVVWGIYALGLSAGEDKERAAWLDKEATWLKQNLDLQTKLQKKSESLATKIKTITDNLHGKNQKALDEKDALITGLHNNTVRLRDRLKAKPACPTAVPKTVAGNSGSDATHDTGLTKADGEFLIRLAERGDTAIRKLTACQNILAAERQTLN